MPEVDFVDNEVTKLSANVIEELMYEMWDDDDNQYLLLEELVGYSKNNNVLYSDDNNIVVKGTLPVHHTTVGWNYFSKWKYGSTTWDNIYNLKE